MLAQDAVTTTVYTLAVTRGAPAPDSSLAQLPLYTAWIAETRRRAGGGPVQTVALPDAADASPLLQPAFDPAIFAYSLTLPFAAVRLLASPTPGDPHASGTQASATPIGALPSPYQPTPPPPPPRSPPPPPPSPPLFSSPPLPPPAPPPVPPPPPSPSPPPFQPPFDAGYPQPAPVLSSDLSRAGLAAGARPTAVAPVALPQLVVDGVSPQAFPFGYATPLVVGHTLLNVTVFAQARRRAGARNK